MRWKYRYGCQQYILVLEMNIFLVENGYFNCKQKRNPHRKPKKWSWSKIFLVIKWVQNNVNWKNDELFWKERNEAVTEDWRFPLYLIMRKPFVPFIRAILVAFWGWRADCSEMNMNKANKATQVYFFQNVWTRKRG